MVKTFSAKKPMEEQKTLSFFYNKQFLYKGKSLYSFNEGSKVALKKDFVHIISFPLYN